MTDRLSLIAPYLDRFKRPFSVLDLGSGIEPDQNIGQEIARNYPAVCTSIERDWSIQKFQASPRTMVIRKNVTVDDLVRLAECEYFDVILGLNIVHWFPNDWLELLDAISSLGSMAFVQVPDSADVGAVNGEILPRLERHLIAEWGEPIGHTVQFPGHRQRPMYFMQNTEIKRLTRSNWTAHDGSADTLMSVSNSELTGRIKRVDKPWIPGINLWTFCNLKGAYPHRDYVLRLMSEFPLPEKTHGDVTPHNFIFDGERLHLIDGYDVGWGESDDRTALEKAAVTVGEMLK